MSDRDPTNPFAPLDNPGCLEAHEMLAGPPPGKRAANADDKARIAALEAEVARLRDALKEAERFMAYFAGETSGSFSGPGTPQSCLAAIRAALEAQP